MNREHKGIVMMAKKSSKAGRPRKAGFDLDDKIHKFIEMHVCFAEVDEEGNDIGKPLLMKEALYWASHRFGISQDKARAAYNRMEARLKENPEVIYTGNCRGPIPAWYMTEAHADWKSQKTRNHSAK